MTALTLLLFLGRAVDAPVWYWVIWGVGMLDWVLDFILGIVKRRSRV